MESNANGPITRKRKLDEEQKTIQTEPKKRKISLNVICKRFPVVSKRVLNNLDDQTLTRSKEVNRDIAKSLEDERFYWIRTIKKHVENFKGHEESWKEVIYKTPINIIKELAIAVQLFFKAYWHENMKMAPLHIGVENGSLQLCQYIISNDTY